MLISKRKKKNRSPKGRSLTDKMDRIIPINEEKGIEKYKKIMKMICTGTYGY